jgi:hypothetical protein
MMAAFLTLSGSAVAQTELTANDVKVIPGLKGELTLDLTTAGKVGGWQLYLVLPEGISLVPTDGELVIGSSSSEATVFKDVKLTRGKSNHQVIGGIDGEGQTLVVCVPTAKEAEIGGTSGELCTIALLADDNFEGTQDCQIKGFLAADPTGATTYEAAAVSFKIIQLKVDVNRDKKVNGTDIQTVINFIVDEDDEPKADINNDGKVNGTDIQELINYIVNEG